MAIQTRHLGLGQALALVCLAATGVSDVRAATVTYFDSSFSSGHWSSDVLTYFDGGIVSTDFLSSGGNPGPYMKISNVVNPGPSPNGVFAFHSRAGAIYTPQLLGPILSIDFNVDVIKLASSFQTPPAQFGFGAALEQNGKVYVNLQGTASDTWITASRTGLSSEDFTEVLATGTVDGISLVFTDQSSHPDFSAAGGLIQLGFNSFNNNGAGHGSTAFVTAGIDNWTVVINTPSTAPGSSQASPVLPHTQLPEGSFVFSDVPSGLWFDPPSVSGFQYVMTSPDSLFTGITGFPVGFTDPFTVSVGSNVLGQFEPDDTLAFPGNGVSEFTITGINPLVSGDDPTAFPLRLTFNTPTASFTMQGIEAVPEPATLLVWSGMGIIGLIVGVGGRRQQHLGRVSGTL